MRFVSEDKLRRAKIKAKEEKLDTSKPKDLLKLAEIYEGLGGKVLGKEFFIKEHKLGKKKPSKKKTTKKTSKKK